MSRSLKIRRGCIGLVKRALPIQGYPRQTDLAEGLGISSTTVSNFLNAKPVDQSNFLDLCERLGFEVSDVADFDDVEPAEEVPGADNPAPPADSSPANSLIDGETALQNLYVKRPPTETTCVKTLLQPGALVRIKASSRMGKTKLLNYVLQRLQRRGYQVALINFYMTESAHLTRLDAFLQWFCIRVGQELERPNRLEELWEPNYSTAKENCNRYFETHLLPEQGAPLVLCLDQVDHLLTHPQIEVIQEFLGLLRAWHESAKTKKRWAAMRLVLLQSTEVYLPLRVNESPFNVGQAIELSDFTWEQTRQLADAHQVPLCDAELRQIFDLVGGHPDLLTEAFTHLKAHGQDTLPQMVALAPTEAGLYRNHLRQHWMVLQENPELADTVAQVVKANHHPIRVASSHAYQLYSRGLVHLKGNAVVIRCQLYQRYFASHLDVL